MTVTRWSPSTDMMRDLESMQSRMNRLFNDFFGGREAEEQDLMPSAWNPAVDVIENEDSFVIEAELPGMKKDEIKISLTNDVLIVQGEKKIEKQEKKKNYHRTERSYGSFSRTFSLPGNVKSDKVDAEFNNGVLTITIPKSEEAKPKQIDVKIK